MYMEEKYSNNKTYNHYNPHTSENYDLINVIIH